MCLRYTTTCGAFDLMASSIRTKSPSALVTTADRMALAPFGTFTSEGDSAKSAGISQAVVEHSPSVLARKAVVWWERGAGAKASADHAARPRVADAARKTRMVGTAENCERGGVLVP